MVKHVAAKGEATISRTGRNVLDTRPENLLRRNEGLWGFHCTTERWEKGGQGHGGKRLLTMMRGTEKGRGAKVETE